MYLHKMLFMLPLLGALVTGVTNGLRKCDDCTHVPQCRKAVNQVVMDKFEVILNMLKKAQSGNMKVCCSDVIFQRRNSLHVEINKRNEMYNQINYEEDIENHPKVNLLPHDCSKEIDPVGRVVGGKKASMNEFPWLALISYNINGRKKFQCGGTVINERNVLTAAHCIKGQEILDVRIGEHDIDSRIDCTGSGQYRTCQRYQSFESNCAPILQKNPVILNDIGLLHLKKPVNLSVANAGTICLPWRRNVWNMNITGKYGVIAGWGKTENRSTSNILLKVKIPILDEEQCKSHYDKKYDEKSERFKSAFCAGEIGRDSCSGDSGGPLMIRSRKKHGYVEFFQFGIVSYGPIQCATSTPGVYTDVRKFMKWILDEIQP